MTSLDTWTRDLHEGEDGTTRPTYTKGSGPGVVVIHELPGMTPDVIAFGEEVVAAGYTVVMPVLFGTPGTTMSFPALTSSLIQVCTSSEFTKLATGKTAPDHRLAAQPVPQAARRGRRPRRGGDRDVLHRRLRPRDDGRRVGGRARGGAAGRALRHRQEARGVDLGLSPADQEAVVARANAGCPVLGLRYRDDKATGTRFQTLETLLGDNFVGVELDGKGHATLTEHRQQEAVDRVLAFFGERLRG